MKRNSGRTRKSNRKEHVKAQGKKAPKENTFYPGKEKVKDLKARTEAQGNYIASILSRRLTFGVGPAGTGKTYVATIFASEAIENGKTNKIIVARPAIEAGESLGYLPGEIEDKFAPYLQPVREIMIERLGTGYTDYLIKKRAIEICPVAYMRGKTFKDCWVILDEAQNLTKNQMKMFLTRIGEGSKVIVNGDPDQSDIGSNNGLTDAINRLINIPQVGICHFDLEDIVRLGLVREILYAYR